MKILNFGSINIDHRYSVDHIVRPGETIASTFYEQSPGGKGANQSVALAKAGACVYHAGIVGKDHHWILDIMKSYKVDTSLVVKNELSHTGVAIIQIDKTGENSIILYPGTNHEITKEYIDQVFASGLFQENDWLVLQNEISHVQYIISKGKSLGMRICFNPAPFKNSVLDYPLEYIDILVVNESEAADLACMHEQMSQQQSFAIDQPSSLSQSTQNPQEHTTIFRVLYEKYKIPVIIRTLGSKGAQVFHSESNEIIHKTCPKTNVIDTTGAGDTFIGYFVSLFSSGMPLVECTQYSVIAASLSCEAQGTFAAIPEKNSVLHHNY